MSEPPDIATLAKRYVELWQDYLSAAAADPELAEMLARLLTTMGGAASLWTRAWPAGSGAWGAGPDGTPQARRPPDEPAAAAGVGDTGQARPAPAAVAPDERDLLLAQLARRLAALEDRLAALESHARERGPGPRDRSRRRRS